jgi:putative DNA primase/helicase
MESPRKLLAGEFPPGACVMLSQWTGSGALGIAEGIETAMAASAMFDMPVWAALTADNMEKWTPPEGCDEVAIFGDNDASYRGHAAAYRLAYRLTCKKMPVTLHFPTRQGDDWNDVLLSRPLN